MNTNAKLALAMAVPAVGMFVGVMMLRGPGVRVLGGVKVDGEKGWYTYAFLTEDGKVHPAHRSYNFQHVREDKGAKLSLVEQARKLMTCKDVTQGAHQIAVWHGRLDERAALHRQATPVFSVDTRGRVAKGCLAKRG